MLENAPTGAVGDYAACTGTTGYDVTIYFPGGSMLPQNGAFQAVKGLRFADIPDGVSNTLMLGEKHVPPDGIAVNPWDCGLFDGHNAACSQRAAGVSFPIAASDKELAWKFGSRHPGLCQFAFCDGTVRALYASIDPFVLGLLAQRNDSQAIPDF